MEILIKENTLRDFINIYTNKLEKGYSKERLATELNILIHTHKVWNRFPRSKPNDSDYHQIVLSTGTISIGRFNGVSWLNKESRKINSQVVFWAKNIDPLEPEDRQKV